MKTHTSGFKNEVRTLGKQQTIQIIYTINGTTTTLTNENINSATPNYEGSLLKSVMKGLELDSNVSIPINTQIQFKYGLLVNGAYEYINYGNYIVYSNDKKEDTNSYDIICYDKMLYSMVDYEDMNITYPITINNYINRIAFQFGLTFANYNQTFCNSDKVIPRRTIFEHWL